MKCSIEHDKYDTKLEASDWRFSATILGLIKYLRHHDFEYQVEDDFILYKSEDISEEKYLEFVEYKYKDELHHIMVENILSSDDETDKQIKLVNEKLVANTIMKKTFNNIKFDGNNKNEILDVINKNRYELIKESYRYKPNMYRNYCNTNQLFNEGKDYCRLLGYTVDAGKKGKSTGYNFNISTFVGQDILEFDFIPFAFTGDREAFFINDNLSIKRLKTSNSTLEKKAKLDLNSENKKIDARQALFKNIIESSEFIDYDIEVIFKDIDKGYFETLYIRKESIKILKKLKENKFDYKSICISYKVNDNYYKDIQKYVTNNILNNIVLDEIIELYLKQKNKSYLVKQLLNINILIRGDEEMKDRLKGAYACAKQVANKLPQNKIDTYKQKLTSSIIFKDYDRVCQILLQLSNYSEIEFGFVYDLFENFEDNKDLAYTFINALAKGNEKQEDNNN